MSASLARWSLLAAWIAMLFPAGNVLSAEAAPLAGAQAADVAAAIEAQAEKLGAPAFAVREKATRQLIEAGIAARAAMRRRLDHPDPEVRSRAEAILRVVEDDDFRRRLDAFAADLDGRRNLDLPGWERFRRELGDGREARAVFVAMQRAESALWSAFASQEPGLSAFFSERCGEVCSSTPQLDAADDAELAVGSIATMLFLAAAPEVNVEDSDALMMETLIHFPAFEQGVKLYNASLAETYPRAPGFAAGMRSGVTRSLYRRLLSMWLAREGASSVVLRKLVLAFNYDIKDGGLDLAHKLLSGDGGPLEARPYALLALARWGTKEDDLKTAESFFRDEKICVKHPAHRRQVKVQVREVALAVALRLTGQDIKSYGFATAQPHPHFLYVAGSLALKDDAARAKAFQEWAEWRAAQQAPQDAQKSAPQDAQKSAPQDAPSQQPAGQ